MEENKMRDYEGMVIIHGDLHIIDKVHNQLVDANWEYRSYPIDSLHITGYKGSEVIAIGYYDENTREIYNPYEFEGTEAEFEQLSRFSIPLKILEGETPSSEEIRYYNEQSFADKNGFLFVDKELSDRLNGKLQIIDIDGIGYEIDAAKLEIRQVENPNLKFSFDYKDLYRRSEKLYSPVTKEPVTFKSFQPIKYPDSIVRLNFPMLLDLDLIGSNVARNWPMTTALSSHDWKADDALIERHPYIDKQIEQQKPWAKTGHEKGNEVPKSTDKNKQVSQVQQKPVRKRGRRL